MVDSGCPFSHNCEEHQECDHHECDHHEGECPHHDCDEEPDRRPCDENHEMISLESDDFFWVGMSDPGEGKVSPVGGIDFLSTTSFGIPRERLKVISSPRAPPPPDGPIFLRLSVLRL